MTKLSPPMGLLFFGMLFSIVPDVAISAQANGTASHLLSRPDLEDLILITTAPPATLRHPDRMATGQGFLVSLEGEVAQQADMRIRPPMSRLARRDSYGLT
ncbi:hypothetical protein [Bradyrhizobium sp. LA7.1]|uniref:hypothetical protein n=1 Tax=Bradyrhizobium sp. LA7.1 TaxID=3156324 RepID=UPI003399E886